MLHLDCRLNRGSGRIRGCDLNRRRRGIQGPGFDLKLTTNQARIQIGSEGIHGVGQAGDILGISIREQTHQLQPHRLVVSHGDLWIRQGLRRIIHIADGQVDQPGRRTDHDIAFGAQEFSPIG